MRRPAPAQVVEWVRALGLRTLLPPEPPPQEVRPGRRIALGLRHSLVRDSAAISHHYDVSNRFYEMVLGPSMTYTCACYPTAESTLEAAQEHKYDLVARKLGLRPGMRLLDVGCGWGGMVVHAARRYGVRVLGVTLSRAQADWATRRIPADAARSPILSTVWDSGSSKSAVVTDRCPPPAAPAPGGSLFRSRRFRRRVARMLRILAPSYQRPSPLLTCLVATRLPTCLLASLVELGAHRV